MSFLTIRGLRPASLPREVSLFLTPLPTSDGHRNRLLPKEKYHSVATMGCLRPADPPREVSIFLTPASTLDGHRNSLLSNETYRRIARVRG